MKKRKDRRWSLRLILLILCLLFVSVPVSAAAKQEWKKVNNKWYYYEDGKKKTGRINYKGKIYYCDKRKNGAMLTGWQKVGKYYYYFDSSGAMQFGWQRVNGRMRYFYKKSGAMAVDRKVSGRPVNSHGAWTAVIVLDPGHSSVVAGGSEPLGPGSSTYKAKDTSGTQGVFTGVEEYKLTMDISRQLQTELKRRGYYRTFLTHTGGKAISCIERTQVANSKNADAYVRIHANGSENQNVNGALTISTTKDSPWVGEALFAKNSKLATCVLESYVQATGARKEYVWYTDEMTGNNWSKVPCTLIEMGYMSNPAEDRKMQDAAYQKQMVNGIANGIDRYFGIAS
ncbi:MAG: N-acetylmuramoyl-L-alanine amidase [Blautia sp.]|jgi:N-acetylmuramoyl-L-alanine amidase